MNTTLTGVDLYM